MSIDDQIAAALTGRKAQREFVENLAKSWMSLTDCWDALMSSAAGAARTAADARLGDRAQAEVVAGLARFLAPGGQWRTEAAEVSGLVGSATDAMLTLQRRVQRETINIGVIGLTHAGKSTLLRKLSGLSDNHIPSNRFESTTATPSRIFHEQDAGAGRAVLTLHTWESFRADVLMPLHERAGIAEPVPATIAEFRGFPYGGDGAPIPEQEAGAERYRRRLRIARDSLASYEGLLTGRATEIGLAELRPYVAYPADDDPRAGFRPYHAVRSVDIFCQFPQLGAVRLGLVDLPGSGEAGLDVHGRFLSDLRNSTDLLFIVKRPEMAPVTDPDWDLAQLADDAAAGVRRSDFAHMVINEDANVPAEYFQRAMARARADALQLGVDVRECDLSSADQPLVYQAILSPVLAMLAERLAYMDRDAAGKVLADLAKIARRMGVLASELTKWAEAKQTDLPNEKSRLRGRAYELKNDLSLALEGVCDEYDRLWESGAAAAELHQEIEKAADEMRKWMADGMGAGSTDEWLRRFRSAEAAKETGRALDTGFNSARQQLAAEFRGIDASLQRSVDHLWDQVADALRSKLTEAIVPVGTDSAEILTAFAVTAKGRGAKTVADAAERLLRLPTEYGSIFLRVGRPVIRKVRWTQEEPGSEPVQHAVEATGGTPGPVTGPALSQPASPAAGGVLGNAVTQAVGKAADHARRWYDRPQAPAPGPSPAAPVAQGRPAGAAAGRPQPRTGEFAEASKWHSRLWGVTERVTSELQGELHTEAQRTLRVLAAAVDLFKDSATSTPGVEQEFEELCTPAQREIWPQDFGSEAARVAADLATLRNQAMEISAAADQVKILATQAGHL